MAESADIPLAKLSARSLDVPGKRPVRNTPFSWNGAPIQEHVTNAMLNNEAFNTPVDTLTALWVTKYGNDWVETRLIAPEDFFIQAYVRLKALGKLEIHYLTDRAQYVCRIPT